MSGDMFFPDIESKSLESVALNLQSDDFLALTFRQTNLLKNMYIPVCSWRNQAGPDLVRKQTILQNISELREVQHKEPRSLFKCLSRLVVSLQPQSKE